MYIKNLQLINFRNYNNLYIEFSPKVNVFMGDNAQGKTNVLESIYYSSIGKSHRTSKDKELIMWDKKEAFIKAYIVRSRIDKKIEIKFFKEGKKGININSIKINKISELMGNINVVMFSPEDLKIVKESPAYRRKFLDIELCKLSSKYYYNLVQYNKILNEKNTALKKWNTNNLDIIDIYDIQLAKVGAYLTKERFRYVDALNKKSKNIHEDITSGAEKIEFIYISQIKNIENAENEFLELFKKNRKSDLERRVTSIGIHRDDLDIKINGIDVRNYGSQGQQRTSVLTMKFSSLEIIKDITGEYPVLLLDDVLSELDSKRQKYILNSIKNIQTIITSTGLHNIKEYIDKDSKIYIVKDGSIDDFNNQIIK